MLELGASNTKSYTNRLDDTFNLVENILGARIGHKFPANLYDSHMKHLQADLGGQDGKEPQKQPACQEYRPPRLHNNLKKPPLYIMKEQISS